jgi:hypothetical protein
MAATTLEALVEEYHGKVNLLKQMQENVEKIRTEIVSAIGNRDEGQETHEIGNFSVRTLGVVRRKLDAEAWANIREEIPKKFWPVKVVTQLDGVGYKWLAENQPDIFRQVAKVVTETPGKTGFSVEVAE